MVNQRFNGHVGRGWEVLARRSQCLRGQAHVLQRTQQVAGVRSGDFERGRDLRCRRSRMRQEVAVGPFLCFAYAQGFKRAYVTVVFQSRHRLTSPNSSWRDLWKRAYECNDAYKYLEIG